MIHKHLQSIEEAVILFRQVLAQQAEIAITDVINADSIRGAELTKVVNNIVVPYSNKDNFIIFELSENNDIDLDMPGEEDNMIDVSSHKLSLVIYGDNSRTLSRKLKARLLSQKVVNKLSNSGMSITGISNIEPATELINTVRYIRRDMTINIVISMSILPVEAEEEIQSIKTQIVTKLN